MIVANELDGLLGCLSDVIQASAALTNMNLLLLFKHFQEDSTLLGEYVFSPGGGDGTVNSDSPLLTGVIGTVDLLMGHASSIVRQHAGQVFLVLFSLLPEEDAAVCSTGYRQKCRDFILLTSAERTDSGGPGEDVVSTLTAAGRSAMLRMISSAILDRRRWQRQEVCLIVSEDILQSAFVDSLTAMGLSSWKGFAQSDSLHMLLCAARECSCSSFLHPMFEIRRMHGQILPLIARASLLFQRDLIVEELRIPFDQTSETGTTGLRHFNSHQGTNIEDGGVDGYGGAAGYCESESKDRDRRRGRWRGRAPSDYRAAVFCVWIAALCNAAEHICELDTAKCNAEYQQALAEEGISSSSSSPAHCWAMEVAGRHSEEISKKRYSSSLKAVLSGGNAHSYRALARSLSCMKIVLTETSHLFLSPLFLRSDAPRGLMHIAHLPEVVSCDFIDAAALCVALMQRLGGDRDGDGAKCGRSKAALLVDGVKEEEGGTHTSKGQLGSAPLPTTDMSLDSTHRDSCGVGVRGCCKEQRVEGSCGGVPVYVLFMRSVMRSAKLSSIPQMLSRGPSCRSTPSSSPMKSGVLPPTSCRIDMTCCGAKVTVTSTYSDVSRRKALEGEASRISSSADTCTSSKKCGIVRNGGEELHVDDGHVGSPTRILQYAAQHRKGHHLDLHLRSPYDTTPLRRLSASKATSSGSASPAERLSPSRLSLPPSPSHCSEVIVVEPSQPEHSQCPSSSCTSFYPRNCTDASSSSSTSWPLLPSLTDPTTDLCRGLHRVEGSAVSAHQWLCESLAPLLPCLGAFHACMYKWMII